MDFNYDEKTDRVNIIAYKESDICTQCDKSIRKVCPLLVCISQNFVYPAAQSLEMKECLLFNTMQDIKNGQYMGDDEDEDEPS